MTLNTSVASAPDQLSGTAYVPAAAAATNLNRHATYQTGINYVVPLPAPQLIGQSLPQQPYYDNSVPGVVSWDGWWEAVEGEAMENMNLDGVAMNPGGMANNSTWAPQ
jgi:hypothetical protein